MVNFVKRDNNDLFKSRFWGFLFKNRHFLTVLRVTVAVLFFYAIGYGLWNPGKENIFTGAVFWGIFWPLFMVVTLPTLGRIFCGICPHGYLGKFITRSGLMMTMPKWLANPFIGLALLVIGWWMIGYMFPGFYRQPLVTAALFSGMTLLAFVLFYLYKDMAYCKSLCPIGVVTRAFGKLSSTRLGTYGGSSCKECQSFDCAKSCPYHLQPFNFDEKGSMGDCTLCMECAHACEAVNFKWVKPSSAMFKKFKYYKAEVWTFILITAAIPVTMSFHHALGRSSISESFIWSKTAALFTSWGLLGGVDAVGLFAFLFAVAAVIAITALGMWIASKILKEEYGKLFYTLGYAAAPLFIIGSFSHTGEMFFVNTYATIMNGLSQGLGMDPKAFENLASRKDAWLSIFSIFNYLAVIWAAIILVKRMRFVKGSALAKTAAFPFAAALILFYLWLHLYNGYVMSTYPPAKGSHGGHGSGAAMFQSVPPKDAVILQSGRDKNSCPNCGMKLPMFYKTNHLLTDEAGKISQYCSIHCLAEVLEGGAKAHRHSVRAIDAKTLQVIDAPHAFYVVGSRKKGTMSPVSKYAFADKSDAVQFAKRNGGHVMTYDEAYAKALEDFDGKALPFMPLRWFDDEVPGKQKDEGMGGMDHGGSRGVMKKELFLIGGEGLKGGVCAGSPGESLLLLMNPEGESRPEKFRRKTGCESVTFAMPDMGYYNLYTLSPRVEKKRLEFSASRFELKYFSHGGNDGFDRKNLLPRQFAEAPIDIIQVRGEEEEFFARIRSGERVRFQVFKEGEPLSGAAVRFETEKGWKNDSVSDAQGYAAFTVIKDEYEEWESYDKRRKEKFLVTVRHSDNQAGEYKGKPYTSREYILGFPGEFYPSEAEYKSYAVALWIGFLTLVFASVAVFIYRVRIKRPYREVGFDEKN